MKTNLGEIPSEKLYCIVSQPDECCPLIDSALELVMKCQDELRGYERANEDQLREMCENIETWLSSLCSNRRGDGELEDIRQRVIAIRYWGEDWKRLAKQHAPMSRTPEEYFAKPLANA